MSYELADRLQALRDEVLETAEQGERSPHGAEVFDACLRRLASFDETDPGLDLTLHESLARRLAWGDGELEVLADVGSVCERLLSAVRRALRGDEEVELQVVEAVTEVGCAAARIIAQAAFGRAGRERAAHLREQAAVTRLEEALARQDQEIAHLEGDRILPSKPT